MLIRATVLYMSGQERTTERMDRALIARVLPALAKLDRATRTKSALAKRAGNMGRSTLDRVFKGEIVYVTTLQNLDDALLAPVGTLEAVGEKDRDALDALDVPANLMTVIAREMASHSKGPARNRRVM